MYGRWRVVGVEDGILTQKILIDRNELLGDAHVFVISRLHRRLVHFKEDLSFVNQAHHDVGCIQYAVYALDYLLSLQYFCLVCDRHLCKNVVQLVQNKVEVVVYCIIVYLEQV